MSKSRPRAPYFAICLNNDNYPASLEVGKLYRVIPDEDAASHGYVRVVDESGEDYAYSTDRFYPVALPTAIEQTLVLANLRSGISLP
jgi:hypothetical protein